MKSAVYLAGSAMIVAGLWAGLGVVAKVAYLTFLIGWNAL